MMIKSTMIVVLVASLFMNCKGAKDLTLEQEAPFTISQSYFQKWVAGVQGGGSGINIYFDILYLGENVEIKSVYFRGKQVSLQTKPSNPSQFIGYFKDAVNQDIIMDGASIKESQNTPPEKIPFQLSDNDAVISYFENSQLHYFKVEHIEEKPLLAYPSSNPNEKL